MDHHAMKLRIPVNPGCRVVVDNDYAGDPDGLVALAHQLLIDATMVVGITCTSIDDGLMHTLEPNAAMNAAAELLRVMELASRPPVSEDASEPFAPGRPPTDGAKLILEESRRESPLPLVIICGGPLTNIASALDADPTLVDRIDRVLWIGGAPYPDGGWEYNASLDLAAARFVFNDTEISLTQFPQDVYRTCLLSLAEMEANLRPAGILGGWLFDRFISPPDFVRLQGVWPMGDSPPVLVTGIGTESSRAIETPTPWITDTGTYNLREGSRILTRYESVDTRLLFADMFARFQLHAASH